MLYINLMEQCSDFVLYMYAQMFLNFFLVCYGKCLALTIQQRAEVNNRAKITEVPLLKSFLN